MSILSSSAENLARLGVNLEITSKAGYLSSTVEQIVKIAVGKGAHVTVHADGFLSSTLENIARIGGKNVTIVI